MDRETIYLDNDEEITSAVDKLKGTDFNSVDLVIPKEALLTQSVVNLKILKRQAESLGKEITIVTQDKIASKLAEQVGIPVIEKPGQEPKVVHMAEGEEAKKMTEDMIEIKEDKPKKAAAEPAEVDKKENTASPIEPTAEVVAPTGVKELSDEDVAEIPSDKIKQPGKEKADKKKKIKIIAIASGFLGLALLIAGYVFIPLANFNIILAAEKKKIDFNFIADKSVSSVDSTEQKIPAREISEEIEKSQKFPTTGKKDVGEKATGTVTIVNHEYSTSAFTVSANSRIVTSSGLVYRTKTNVTIDGYTKVGGVITDKKATVGVIAEQAGEKYNVTGGTMIVPGLMTNGVTAADVYATGGAFTGGTTKTIKFVTQADINAAKEEMKKVIEAEAKKLALEKTEREERFLEGAIKITEISAESSVAINGEASEFELKAKSKLQALVFKDEDLKQLAQSVLGDQIGSGKEIVESDSLTSSTEFVEADFEKGTLGARLAGEAYIATKIDQDELKIELTNESEDRAMEIVKTYDGVTDIQVKHFPSFYKKMPRLKNHIYIKTEISKEQ